MADVSQVSHLDEEYRSAKIIHKRRSSIFCRQNITFNQQENDNKITTNKTELASNEYEEDTQTGVESFDLEKYIEKLKQERKDWQQEYKKRKSQRKNLTKQKAIAESQGQLLDLNILTKSERAFIRARPNYEYICKNSQKLSDVALKISTLSQVVNKLNQRFMEKMENNISRASRDIIEMLED
ncbi:uncharacterized protein LOC116844852 [Odontomachus brunneus]|uniref:uncharacterized protein LOC116844852 n=1 Tax=Odontomachus brunneus TaxID=486640 RepID=UPI0013F25755|nr:uncharacterized protein LOC116844852 [Odontomachus brunneus]